MSRVYVLVITAVLGSVLLVPLPAQAQSNRLCFNVPGITHCIEGRFREYWEQNGGLPVFGYPITVATNQQTAEGTFLTQYFERNRFELHAENARPYDVLLGRLGDDRLKQQGRNWQDFGTGKAENGCVFFRETGHSVCDLEAGVGFKTYWEGHGLQDPQLSPFQRSLALFGLPLSELTVETNATGDTVITQWFERARLEYHLDNPRQSRVLLGLLGNEIRTPPPLSATPLPPQEPNPDDACAGVGGAESAIAVPDCVRVGETLVISLFGFNADAALSITLTNETAGQIGSSQSVRANRYGNATITIDTNAYRGVTLRSGTYILRANDTQGRTAQAPFRVLP